VQVVDNEKNRLYAHGILGMTIIDPETCEEFLFIPHECSGPRYSEFRVLWGAESASDRL